jgi:hypothetical protein
MKTQILAATIAALAASALSLSAQAANMQPKLEDTCSVTGQANEVRRIDLVRLPNGYFGHRAYDAKGKLICYSEWSATPALNVQAAEILRAKGDNRAIIVNQVFPRE